MKVIIAGSRTIHSYKAVCQAIAESGFEVTEVVSGGASGVDTLGERWARGKGINIRQFLPDWAKFGKSAAYKRNVQMGDYADGLIAIWDGASKGTGHMLTIARDKGLAVHLAVLPDVQELRPVREWEPAPEGMKAQVWIRDKFTCQDCHIHHQKGGDLDVHHILPYRLGGEHELSNLVLLCKKCHRLRDNEYRYELKTWKCSVCGRTDLSHWKTGTLCSWCAEQRVGPAPTIWD